MLTMRTMRAAPRRGVRLLAPLLLAVATVAPSHTSAAAATPRISDVLVVESAICDAASAQGHFQASARQVDILAHGATSACVVIHTDATAGDTFSISTVDASNMSVYSRGPIKSQAAAGGTLYYLLSPHMTYQNGANAAWPDGIYTTSVIIDGAGASTATWAVGVPLPSPTPSSTIAAPAPAATPAGSGTPSVGRGVPVAAGTPATPLYHAQPGAPYTMRPLGGLGMHGPLTGAALDTAGDALLYADRSTYDGATKGYINDYHIYLLSAAGQVRELPLPDGVTDLIPKAMNDHGEVVGYSYAASQGFVYRSGAWQVIAGGIDADPFTIDNAGNITGSAALNDGDYAFLANDRGGEAKALGTLPCGCATWGAAIDPKGVPYGYAWDHSGTDHAVAFPANGGPAIDLGTLPGTQSSREGAVNAAGVVGGTAVLGGTIHATRYDGTQHDLGGVPGWVDGAATGIDRLGRIVGSIARSEHGAYVFRAFVADDAGPHDLTTLAGLDSGSTILRATAENADGVILAEAKIGSDRVPVLLTPSRRATNPLPGKLAGFPGPVSAQ